MYWGPELLIMIRILINDLETPATYSDDRITQLAVVSARYVIMDANLSVSYSLNIVAKTISPDPADPNSYDDIFLGLIALKSACLLDQSTFRTRAALEGLSARLGPAALTVGGSLSGYKTILESGPCALYDALVFDYNVGNATAVRAVLSPFVGNNFDPSGLSNSRDNRY